jgi:sulfatase modifying factor 1
MHADSRCLERAAYTPEPGANESLPMNCVTWYLAMAFCIWDEGRLPSEAEWEYASAGGSENRLYPWGPEPPDSTRSSFGRALPRDIPVDEWPALAELLPAVGQFPSGRGRYGHYDLGGSLWEWTLDLYDYGYYALGQCVECVNVERGENRVYRGGAFNSASYGQRATARFDLGYPWIARFWIGFRCARDLG